MEARRQRTAYLGPEASFSHQAAVEALPHTEAVPLPSFKAILKAIQGSGHDRKDDYDYAVLPVENSTNGSVVQALDLLAQCGLDPGTSSYPDIKVVDEHYLEVHHCLFVARAWAEAILDKEEFSHLEHSEWAKTPTMNGLHNDLVSHKEASDVGKASYLKLLLNKLSIKTLYSHPQVWGQCNNILSALLPPGHVERIDTSSTSAAAAFVAGATSGSQEGIAAISSSLAGAKHSKGLICVASNIEDEPGTNTTRFLILRNQTRAFNKSYSLDASVQESAQIKSLWAFTIAHHVPGSLATTLAVFAKHGFNLSAIQSRPRPKDRAYVPGHDTSLAQGEKEKNWKYVFFVECLHNNKLESPGTIKAEPSNLLQDLKSVTERVRLLGSWRDRLA